MGLSIFENNTVANRCSKQMDAVYLWKLLNNLMRTVLLINTVPAAYFYCDPGNCIVNLYWGQLNSRNCKLHMKMLLTGREMKGKFNIRNLKRYNALLDFRISFQSKLWVLNIQKFIPWSIRCQYWKLKLETQWNKVTGKLHLNK